jgi:two-component system NarL family sensor kinase
MTHWPHPSRVGARIPRSPAGSTAPARLGDLRRLVVAQIEAHETERTRVARLLQDDLQQMLAAIQMDLAAAAADLEQGPAVAASPIARAQDLADTMIVSTRRIVTTLRPRYLDELGLAAALLELGRDFSRRTMIDCVMRQKAADVDDLSPRVALCLFRIAEEALRNVERHAAAHHVVLTLDAPRTGTVTLCIDDDGRGIGKAAWRKPGATGLLSMRERTEALGGSLRLHARPTGGTRVTAALPRRGDQSAGRSNVGRQPRSMP